MFQSNADFLEWRKTEGASIENLIVKYYKGLGYKGPLWIRVSLATESEDPKELLECHIKKLVAPFGTLVASEEVKGTKRRLNWRLRFAESFDENRAATIASSLLHRICKDYIVDMVSVEPR
jgi:hypothetical protein